MLIKIPDFASRLRGFINIKGPNPINDEDDAYIVRRSILIRSFIERNAKNIINMSKKSNIDINLVRALLKTKTYLHGTRSMEAIFDMSMLEGKKSFEQAYLPTLSQLKAHLDADDFYEKLRLDSLYEEFTHKIAVSIHRYYCMNTENKSEEDRTISSTLLSWESLGESEKKSNYSQAESIPYKLKALNCGLEILNEKNKNFRFTKEEIEIIAKMEHKRWVAEKLHDGWQYVESGKTDKKNKKSPYLVRYEVLEEKVKEYDRETAIDMPKILAEDGFGIYRKK